VFYKLDEVRAVDGRVVKTRARTIPVHVEAAAADAMDTAGAGRIMVLANLKLT
jgi:hypothetical protein